MVSLGILPKWKQVALKRFLEEYAAIRRHRRSCRHWSEALAEGYSASRCADCNGGELTSIASVILDLESSWIRQAAYELKAGGE